MVKFDALWKAVLGACLLTLCVLYGFMLLIREGKVQPVAPREETASLTLPEGVDWGAVCRDREFRNHCWMEVKNQPGCYVWVYVDGSGRQVRWDGKCSEGLAAGTGSWVEESWFGFSFFGWSVLESAEEGLVVNGRRQGSWIARLPDGRVQEQPYMDGFRHGIQNTYHRNGHTTEVRYLLGKRYGNLIERGPDGEILESLDAEIGAGMEELLAEYGRHGRHEIRDDDGKRKEVFFVERRQLEAWAPSGPGEKLTKSPFPDNGLTGNYLLRLNNGARAEGPFVDGKMQGEWTFRSRHGSVSRGSYVDDVRTGDWTETLADGTVGRGPHRWGDKHGKWVTTDGDGIVAEGPYKNGSQNGRWVYRFPDGNVWEGVILQGRKHAEWTRKSPDGSLLEGLFLDGDSYGTWTENFPDGSVAKGTMWDWKKSGEWLETHPDGSTAQGHYANDKRYGDWVFRLANGETQEGPYVRGKRNGVWTVRLADGKVIEEQWKEGELLDPS